MNWSRAKTILIALLLAVNTFLIVTYITRDNELRNDEMTVRSDVCKILSAQGIKVSEEIIPLDSVGISPAILEIDTDMEKSAKRLLGEISKNETSDGTIYSGSGGSIMFSSNSFSLVYESGEEIENIEGAEKIAASFASKLGISVAAGSFESSQADGGYTVRVPQVVSGVPVFDCFVDFRISESGGIIASGKFIGKGGIKPVTGKVINTSALMLSFADGIRERGKLPLSVTGIKLGYVSKKTAAGAVSLSPTIEYKTEKETFYVDMQTGEFGGL